MSLILCPKCGGRVSTMAGTCPGCGVAIRTNLTKCPSCGAQALQTEGTCPSCGHLLPKKDETERTTQPAKIQPSASPIAQPLDAEKPTSDEATQCSPRKNHWRFAVAAVVLLVLAAGGYYGYILWQRQQEETHFAQVMQTTQPEFCEEYLERYPYSLHREEVELHLQQLLEEEEEWNSILASPTQKTIKAFLEAHPETVHERDCETLLDSLDWAEALVRKTEKSLVAYVEAHPNGTYIEEANHLLEQAKRCRVTPQNVTMVRGVLESFFTRAFVDHKAKDVRDCLAADTLQFGGKSQATVADVMASELAAKEKDVLGKHFMVKGEPKIEKTLDEADVLTYHVRCTMVQTINRSNAKKNISLTHRVQAVLTEDFKLMGITIQE